MKTIIAYIPVLHQGYLNFFQKHAGLKNRFIVPSTELLITFCDYLRKDLRSLSPEIIVQLLESMNLFEKVSIYGKYDFSAIQGEVFMPEEDISHEIEKALPKGVRVFYDNVFLRWDGKNSTVKNAVNFDREITPDDFLHNLISKAYLEAKKSSDWWRRVGVLVFRQGEILISGYNHHLPTSNEPYFFGDPRGIFSKGINIELSTAIHGEAFAIAEAAKRGISLNKAEMLCTTFPCPPCAKLITNSGIRRIYFIEGYTALDTERILRDAGVEIVFLKKEPAL